ncbi:MAG: type II toxin-antitoxin system prevent-host-death family antitoxin [Pseudomonadota bacterium]
MRVTSSTELRANLSKMMDQVTDDRVPLIITRSKGASAVMISLEDYQALDETAYLLAVDANREILLGAVDRINAGEAKPRTLIDPDA